MIKRREKKILKKRKKIKILFITFFLYLIIIFSYYYKLTRYPNDIFFPHKVFIESHRGVNREIFQNTLEAFKRAIKYKIDSIETDVWLTKDKELVLIHGRGRKGKIKGYYNHGGNVIDLTWKRLSFYRTIRDNLTFPRLRELMKLAKNKIFINLEIKDPRIDLVFPHIIKLIEEFDFFQQISLSSFNLLYYDKIQEYNKRNNKNLVFGNIYSKGYKGEYNYSRKGSSLNLYWTNATKEVCYKAHKNRMAVLAWFYMNDTENNDVYKKLIENGVDVICCNEPLLAKNYRDNYYLNNKINKFFFSKNLYKI